MTRFLLIPLLLAAATVPIESYAPEYDADATCVLVEVDDPIVLEPFVFADFTVCPDHVAVDVDLLAQCAIEDEHAAEARLVLRDREDGLLVA